MNTYFILYNYSDYIEGNYKGDGMQYNDVREYKQIKNYNDLRELEQIIKDEVFGDEDEGKIAIINIQKL